MSWLGTLRGQVEDLATDQIEGSGPVQRLIQGLLWMLFGFVAILSAFIVLGLGLLVGLFEAGVAIFGDEGVAESSFPRFSDWLDLTLTCVGSLALVFVLIVLYTVVWPAFKSRLITGSWQLARRGIPTRTPTTGPSKSDVGEESGQSARSETARSAASKAANEGFLD